MALSLALWSSRESCLKPVLKHWTSLSWSIGPSISWWHWLLILIISSEELSSAGKEGIMTTMVKKIFITTIMVTAAIKITSPECFSRPTTSRDESKYAFSLEFEFFNFSHMIELLETQYQDIKLLVNMTRNRGILVSDICFNTEYLDNDEQYQILRSTKDLDVQVEAGILFLGNNSCAFLRTETILECSHLNRLYSLHLPTSPQKMYFTLQDDHIKLTGKQAQHKIICHNNSINVNLHSLISTESLSLMESISSLRKFGQAINLFSKTKRTHSEILLGSLGTYFLQNLVTQNTGPSTAQSLALFSKVQRLTTTLITDLQLEIFSLENERVQNTISKLKSQELSRTQ